MSTPYPVQRDTGGGIRVFDQNPFTNPSLLSGGENVNKTFTPGEQSGQVTVYDGSGTPYPLP